MYMNSGYHCFPISPLEFPSSRCPCIHIFILLSSRICVCFARLTHVYVKYLNHKISFLEYLRDMATLTEFPASSYMAWCYYHSRFPRLMTMGHTSQDLLSSNVMMHGIIQITNMAIWNNMYFFCLQLDIVCLDRPNLLVTAQYIYFWQMFVL